MKASAKGVYIGQLAYISRVFVGHNQEFAVNEIIRFIAMVSQSAIPDNPSARSRYAILKS